MKERKLTELEIKLLTALQKLTAVKPIAEQKYWRLFLRMPYQRSLRRKKQP